MATSLQDSLLIVPGFGEADPNPTLVSDLLDGSPVRFLLVVDGPPAGLRAQRLAVAFPGRIRLWACPDREDRGRLLRWGFRYALTAGHQTVLIADPRRFPNPDQLAAVRMALTDADVAVARGPGRSRISHTAICRAAGFPVVDLTSPLEGFGRQVVESMREHRFHEHELTLQIELLKACYKYGFRIVGV
jgi:hypothetical protein